MHRAEILVNDRKSKNANVVTATNEFERRYIVKFQSRRMQTQRCLGDEW